PPPASVLGGAGGSYQHRALPGPGWAGKVRLLRNCPQPAPLTRLATCWVRTSWATCRLLACQSGDRLLPAQPTTWACGGSPVAAVAPSAAAWRPVSASSGAVCSLSSDEGAAAGLCPAVAWPCGRGGRAADSRASPPLGGDQKPLQPHIDADGPSGR